MTSPTLLHGQHPSRRPSPPSVKLGRCFLDLVEIKYADTVYSATQQLILLPGNDYTSAATFISNGSGPALMKVTNPDGSTTGLIFDVHKYLDSDNSYVPHLPIMIS